MTTSWGGTSLPDPTNITLLDDFAGAQFQTIDGVLHTDERNHRTAVSTRMERILWVSSARSPPRH